MKRNLTILAAALMILSVLLGACSPEQPAEPTAVPVEPTEAPEKDQPTQTTEVEPTEEPDPLVVTDDLGTDVSLIGPAQRIVSLSPSMTEIVFAIGAGDRLVGRDSNSIHPEEALDVKDLGGFWESLPVEDIVALEPDLVLAAQIITEDQVGELSELGLNVFWQENPQDFQGLFDNIAQIAELTGNQEEAAELNEQLKDRVEAVEASLEGVEEMPLVFYELDATDPTNPWTTGSGTFISYIIQKAKGENLGDVLDGEWAQISSEELVAQNPDVILLADAMYGVTAESVAERAGWSGIKAVVEGEIYPIDPSIMSVPGPRLVDGLEEAAAVLHPDQMEN